MVLEFFAIDFELFSRNLQAGTAVRDPGYSLQEGLSRAMGLMLEDFEVEVCTGCVGGWRVAWLVLEKGFTQDLAIRRLHTCGGTMLAQVDL